jgi:hypothetical protein
MRSASAVFATISALNNWYGGNLAEKYIYQMCPAFESFLVHICLFFSFEF